MFIISECSVRVAASSLLPVHGEVAQTRGVHGSMWSRHGNLSQMSDHGHDNEGRGMHLDLSLHP